MNEQPGRIEIFEDLVAWQKARILNREIYAATSSGMFLRDLDIVRQMRRAWSSIMSNIAEGFERGGRPEFAQFLSIAKASSAEVRSLLYAALDGGLVDAQTFSRLRAQAEEVGRIVGGLRAAVAKQR
jgi:four helix bundle protein